MDKLTTLSKNRYVLLSIFIVLFLFIAKAYLNHIFFFDFGDEDDNFMSGKLLLQSVLPYKDYFAQHQPLTYLASSLVQITTHPANIYLLVKKHREFMIVWSFLWGIVLIYRFRLPLFISVVVIELTKISLFGNLFLAESLVIYPLLYVIAYFFSNTTQKWLELIFVSLLLPFIFFNLLPLWPLVIVLAVLLIWQTKEKKKTTLLFVGIFALFAIPLFLIFPFAKYFYQTIFVTYAYYVPLTDNTYGHIAIVNSFLSPVIALATLGTTPLLWVIKSLSLGLLISMGILLWKKQYYYCIVVFLLLGIASLRYIPPDQTLNLGFHMLPWFVVLTVTSIYLLQKVFLEQKSPKVKIIVGCLFGMIMVNAFFQAQFTLFDHRNPATDYYVHYSPVEDYTRELTIVHDSPNDTLFIVVENSLLYWSTNVKLFSQYTFWYGWMEQIPSFKTTLNQELTTNKPVFFMCGCKKSFVRKYLSNYQVTYKDSKPTELYIRKDKVAKITDKQKKDLVFYHYTLSKTNF